MSAPSGRDEFRYRVHSFRILTARTVQCSSPAAVDRAERLELATADNSSGYKCVSWHKGTGKYVAEVNLGFGKKIADVRTIF